MRLRKQLAGDNLKARHLGAACSFALLRLNRRIGTDIAMIEWLGR